MLWFLLTQKRSFAQLCTLKPPPPPPQASPSIELQSSVQEIRSGHIPHVTYETKTL